MKRYSFGSMAFCISNGIILTLLALLAVLPLLHLGALSLSTASKAEAGLVGILPVEFSLEAYRFIFSNSKFIHAFGNSVLRLLLGVPINMILVLFCAYPLSRGTRNLRFRGVYTWFFIITMIFSGGTVPLYMLVSALGLKDNIFSLVLPGAVPVFNVVLMLNFFRQIPEDYHEAAEIDGAGELRTLFQIYVPLSVPSLVTITLFVVVNHWNAWFDGMIYMSFVSKYPLQTYLQAVVINKMDIASTGNLAQYDDLSQRTIDAARLFLAIIPIAVIYFPLQKYFVQGLTLGGVKG